MKSSPVHALIGALFAAGCFPTDEGVPTPLDKLYFPVGLAVDASNQHLFAVNSNFDLQYNGGAVQSYKLDRIRSLIPQGCTSDGACCTAKSLAVQAAADRTLYPGLCTPVNPTEPQDGGESLVTDSVGIGAFATDILYRSRDPLVPNSSGRLFVPVRGDATLHFIDVDVDGVLDCGQAANGGDCDDNHRRGDNPEQENTRKLRMPSEPFGIDATPDTRGVLVTHQTEGKVSLFVNDWDTGPVLEFVLGGLPLRPIGIAHIPEPEIVKAETLDVQPGFLVTFRDSAEIHLVRFFDDAVASPERPYITDTRVADVRANSVGFDSRGVAIDASKRQACEAVCDAKTPPDFTCLQQCAAVPLGIYVANRTPASLLVGETQPNATALGSDDLPRFIDSIGLKFGPSKVTVGNIMGRDGKPQLRVFVVCFDTRALAIYDPVGGDVETWITTGRGPHAFAVDFDPSREQLNPPQSPALGYIGHFTDSYVGVVELDQRSPNYGEIVLSIGTPAPPRASK